MPKGDRVFYSINDLILLISLLVVAYPIIYIFSASISSASDVINGNVFLWPVHPTLEGYVAVFKDKRILTGYGNTIIYTIGGTIISLILTTLYAYPLSRKDLPGRKFFTFLITFTMIFSGGMLPTYLMIKQIGIIDSRWAILLASAINAFNIIIMRTYFQTNIPDELLEAASLDGCSDFRFLLQIVLPLSKAITAVMVLYYGVGQWNSFFNAFLYLTKQELFPLQIILRDILISNQNAAMSTLDPELAAAKQGLAELLRYSLIIVASVPVWIAYPFVQKYFVKGIMVGSVKG